MIHSTRRGTGAIVISAVAIAAAGAVIMTTTAFIAPGSAWGASTQVWVHIDSREAGPIGQSVSIQLPLEWVQDLEPVEFTDTDGNNVILDGRHVYEQYRNLPAGRKADVLRIDDESGTVRVHVISRSAPEVKLANRLHVLVKEGTPAGDVNLRLPLRTVKSLRGLLLQTIRNCEPCRRAMGDDVDSYSPYIERITQRLDSLDRMAPFDLVRIAERGERVLVRTLAD